jgi:molecular chaperone DnaJ
MAEKPKDLYAILEVEKTATSKEIKQQYRKLSKIHHPDVSEHENAQKIFEEIQNAYETLMDPEERKRYDDFFKLMSEGKHTSFKDVYSLFQKKNSRTHMPIKGEDVEMKVEFLISEVRQGLLKIVSFDRYINCDDCSGHGFHRDSRNICPECKGKGNTLSDVKTPFGNIAKENTCSNCKGNGYVNVQKCSSCNGEGKKLISVKVSFPLPTETTEGTRITLKEKGDVGLNGGKNGDLLLTMTQSPKDIYQLTTDFDITMRLDVPFLTCLTGGTVSITLPKGETVKLPIKRGTQTGDQIIVPEAGLFNPANGFYGTLSTVVNILVPSKLPEEKINKLIHILG